MTTPLRQTDEALHEQQEWLRVTLSSIGDGVITIDNKGGVTFLNPVAQSHPHAEVIAIRGVAQVAL